MKKRLALALWLYTRLLSFYPAQFLAEFQDEMVSVFAAMLGEAAQVGAFPLLKVCLRELRDFPLNLLRAHLKEGSMVKMLRSQPVDNSLRLALGLGLAGLFSELLSLLLLPLSLNADIIGELQGLYFDFFKNEHGIGIVAWLPDVLNSILAGLVLGLFLALLFAERSKYARYMIIGLLGWFLHRAGTDIFLYSANLDFYLSPQQAIYFSQAKMILAGAFLGLTIVVARSEKNAGVRLLAAGAILYPLLTFVYIRLLFKLYLYTNPVIFIALLSLAAVCVASVFLIAIKSTDNRKLLWLVVAGALGYPFLTNIGPLFVARLYLPASPLEFSWPGIFNIALNQGVYGLLFGLLFGLTLGIQKNSAAYVKT
jgi:hypothetical protein